MEEIKKRCVLLILALIIVLPLLPGFMITPARAQGTEPILHLQLLIVGPKLTVKQETLALPRNIPLEMGRNGVEMGSGHDNTLTYLDKG